MDDLISRQALKQAMYHEAFEVDSEMQKWDGGCWIRYRLVEKIVDSMPSVQPTQKTGRWIEHIDERGDTYYECSNCKEAFTYIEGTPADNLYNHCPNCGSYNEGKNDKL